MGRRAERSPAKMDRTTARVTASAAGWSHTAARNAARPPSAAARRRSRRETTAVAVGGGRAGSAVTSCTVRSDHAEGAAGARSRDGHGMSTPRSQSAAIIDDGAGTRPRAPPQGSHMEPIIQVDGLVKRYKKADHPAVDGISFDVRPGELFAFLGPNGAGKTTTISILTTTLAKTAGTVPDRRPRPGPRREGRPPEHRHHLPEPEPRPSPVGRGEHPDARRAVRPLRLPAVLPDDAERVPRSHPGAGRRRRTGRRGLPSAEDVLGRDEAEARDHPEPDASAVRAVPRRAHVRASIR